MSAYEYLLDCCAAIVGAGRRANDPDEIIARVLLAEVLRTLEKVTPEMLLERPAWSGDVYGDQAKETFIAMLHACPLEPPK